MIFSIDRDLFAKVLKRIDSVASNRSSFAVLNSCLIDAKQNEITVTGTDLEITLEVVDKAFVSENGCVILNARRLLETVSNLESGISITLSTEGSQVLIEAGNFRARIPSGDLAEFPKIPKIESKAIFAMPAAIFKDLIDKTSFSISRDDSRADFTGALLKVSQNGRVEMVSTDGHRLSRMESQVEITGNLPANFEKGVIIPLKGLSEIPRNFLDGDVSVDLSGSKIILSSPQTTLYINLIAGQFPDFSKVIPSFLDHKAIINRDSFQQILKRASIFTAKVGTIRLTMSPGKIEISTFDANSGEMKDFINCDYDGKGVTAGFNWRYIDDILKVIDGDTVSFEVIDTDSPALLRDTASKKLDYIVMPMQL